MPHPAWPRYGPALFPISGVSLRRLPCGAKDDAVVVVAGPLAPSTAFCSMTTCLQQEVDWVSDWFAYLRVDDKLIVEPTVESDIDVFD